MRCGGLDEPKTWINLGATVTQAGVTRCAIGYASKMCVYMLLQNTAALSRYREHDQHNLAKEYQTPLAGVWHFGLHRRCSHTVQPARVSSSNASKKYQYKRQQALFVSQHKAVGGLFTAHNMAWTQLTQQILFIAKTSSQAPVKLKLMALGVLARLDPLPYAMDC